MAFVSQTKVPFLQQKLVPYYLPWKLEHIKNAGERHFIVFIDQKALSLWRQSIQYIIDILIKANQLRRLKYNIVFCWIPGHSGVIGNEQADMVALVFAESISECQIPALDINPFINQNILEKRQAE